MNFYIGRHSVGVVKEVLCFVLTFCATDGLALCLHSSPCGSGEVWYVLTDLFCSNGGECFQITLVYGVAPCV